MNVAGALRITWSLDAVKNLGQAQDFIKVAQNLANGVAAGQVDVGYADVRTVAAVGTDDTFDLRGGSILGTDGTVASFVRIKVIVIAHKDTAATYTFGGGANAWATAFSTMILPPVDVATNYSVGLWANPNNGASVTAGTGDIFRAAISTGTNKPYYVFIAGASA